MMRPHTTYIARASVPDAILRVSSDETRQSLALLYCFVKVKLRLPRPGEVWRRRQIGRWVAWVRDMDARGLIKGREQRDALAAIPLWPIAAQQPRAGAALASADVPSAPASSVQQQAEGGERAPLLSKDAPPPRPYNA